MMKGQYMAVETIITFGMGIVLAIGTVTLFTLHKSESMDTIEDRQMTITESRIADAVQSLRNSDRAEKNIRLPSKIGEQDYTIAFKDGVVINSREEKRKFLTHMAHDYSFSGSADGGDIKIIKEEEEYVVGPA